MLILILAYVGGILSIASPCILPVPRRMGVAWSPINVFIN
ncbi:Uncharacterised protein [Serratia quinivorans]|jgi:cytochrome c biogenesis protein CcdA|nr:Uncharacterised protein [Serratia proteamaculans]CAI1103643.1 Uncharacterised protein [Serratia proteamaculans]CAI1179518.1 Uncharacterised protein [Serratia proteamaculans]SPZ51915.1 Uncharacterised protein [Serratia quinivorans]